MRPYFTLHCLLFTKDLFSVQRSGEVNSTSVFKSEACSYYQWQAEGVWRWVQLQRNPKDMHPVSLEIKNQETIQSYLTDVALKATSARRHNLENETLKCNLTSSEDLQEFFLFSICTPNFLLKKKCLSSDILNNPVTPIHKPHCITVVIYGSVCVFVLGWLVVSDSVTPRTVARQVPLSVGFLRREY